MVLDKSLLFEIIIERDCISFSRNYRNKHESIYKDTDCQQRSYIFYVLVFLNNFTAVIRRLRIFFSFLLFVFLYNWCNCHNEVSVNNVLFCSEVSANDVKLR